MRSDTTPHHPSSGYRADIDGLRAVAVLSVIFFHLGILGFSGGFVGVDVFFVISGYLITGFVQAEIVSEAFTLRAFYLRRLRRLGPSLLAVSLAVSVAAWFVLFPEDMRSFAASLGLQFTALQNFFFLADGEYFRGSDTKPLLHTWSLAVEEQFYLVWPLLLLVTRRFARATRLGLLGALLLLSFFLNLALVSVSPKASFFLLPPRAWELGLGGIVALLERERFFEGWNTSRTRELFGLVGLAAILGSMLALTPATPFPGVAALLPVLGSVLVIVAGIGGTSRIGRGLSGRLMVHVGLISYPLYLWHWPLIAFARYLKWDTSRIVVVAGVVVMSFVLAELTYRYLETPIRRRGWLSSPGSLVRAGAFSAALLVVFAVHSYASEGAAYRFSPRARALLTAPFHAQTERCGFVFRALHPRAQVCALHAEEQPRRRVLLWGNSHADMWSKLLVELGQRNRSSVYLNARNCRATSDSDFCGREVQAAIMEFVRREGITDVVLASTWFGAFGLSDSVFEQELGRVVAELVALDVRTWLVLDIPDGAELSPLQAFERNPSAPTVGAVPISEFLVKKQREQALFAVWARANPRVKVIDSSVGLCSDMKCSAGNADVVWYRDNNHLTHAGAETAAGEFAAIFSP